MITEFKNEYRWLSNFSPCIVMLDGIEYHSVENAYQAAKTLDFDTRLHFTDITAGDAKRAGRELRIRDDWDEVKVSIMKDLLIQKFSTIGFKTLLIATGLDKIQEGNNWGDTFWGVDLKSGEGKNMLGKIIMEIRDNYYLYKEVPFDFDLKRMEKALEGPFYTMPPNLTIEEMHEYILSIADDDNE